MRIALTAAATLLIVGSFAWADDKPAQDRFVGEWVNANAATRSLKRLVVSNAGDAWTVEAWGSGGGGTTEIPWNKTPLNLLGSSVAAKSLDHGFAIFDAKFETTYLTLHMEKDQLVVEEFTIFNDKSGRSNYRTQEVFNLSK